MDKHSLHYKLIPDDYLDSAGQIKEEFKYKVIAYLIPPML